MFKKLILALALFSCVTHADTVDSNDLLQQFNQMSDENKASAKIYLETVEWIEIGTSGGDSYAINYKRLKSKPYGIIEAWVKATVIKDIVKDGLSLGDHTLFLYNFNCADESMKNLTYTNYIKAGNKTETITKPAYESFKPVIPNSVGEKLLNSACDYYSIKSS